MTVTTHSIASKAEFNEIYNHYHAGNYQATIQLVERYAPREVSSELFRMVYQSYRLLSFWALSNLSTLKEESNRLLELTGNFQIKTVFNAFNLLSEPTSTLDEIGSIVKTNEKNDDEESHIIYHFLAIIYCCLLSKKNKFCQVIDILFSFSHESCSHFELEKLAILSYSALKVNQLDLATKSTSEMKKINLDAIPTLVSSMVLNIYLKNLSLWNIPFSEELQIKQSLTESLLAIKETIESYGGHGSCPQLANIYNIASYLQSSTSDSVLFPTHSDLQSNLNSIWFAFRNGEYFGIYSRYFAFLIFISSVNDKSFTELLDEKSQLFDRVCLSINGQRK